jgi:hypothetical protein
MPIPSTRFTSLQFTATNHSTVVDKATFAEALLAFIESGCSVRLFTEKLYRRLSMCFGHIAYYNRISFYDHWFETAKRRLAFLQHTLRYSCCGDPESTFCDAERIIQEELRGTNILQRYHLAAEKDTNKLTAIGDSVDRTDTPLEIACDSNYVISPDSDTGPVAG